MPKRLGGGEQFVEVENAQQPGAPECGVIDRIGSGQRPGVGQRRLCAERCRPDLTTSTGFARAAARAADMNLRASPIDST